MPSLGKCLLKICGWFGLSKKRQISQENLATNVVYNEFKSKMDVIQSDYKILMIFETEWTIADTVEYAHKLKMDPKWNRLGLYQIQRNRIENALLAFRPGFFEFINKYRMHSDYIIYTAKDFDYSIKLANNIENIINQQTIPELLDDSFKFKMVLSSFDTETFTPSKKTFETVESELGVILLEYDLILIIDAYDVNYTDTNPFIPTYPIVKPSAPPYDPFFTSFILSWDVITNDDIKRAVNRIKDTKTKSMMLYEIQLPRIIEQYRK